MKQTLGLDIGGSTIKAVLLGKGVEYSSVMPTPKNKKAFFKALEMLLRQLPVTSFKGIGLGFPGLIDRDTGEVLDAPNAPFLKGKDLAKFFSRFHAKVYYDNDVKCILRAESSLGVAKNYKNVALVALGTGIGGGLLIDGKIYYGNMQAGEIGKMVLDAGKTFEQLAGGKTIQKHNEADFKRIGKYLGLACANLINILEPEAVVLCGGVMIHHGTPAMKYAKPLVAKYVLTSRAKRTKIFRGQLGEFAGSIGAALLVR